MANTYTTLEALVARIVDQMTINGANENNGARTQQLLIEIAQSIIAIIGAAPAADGSIHPWDAGLEYIAGEQVIVSHNGYLYLFTGVVSDQGTEPGTDETVWQDLTALILSHVQGTDQALDTGGPNEVTALELRQHLDGDFDTPTLAQVLAAGERSGANDIGVDANQAIVFRDDASDGRLRLKPVAVTDDNTIYLPDKPGTVALMDDVAAVAAMVDGSLKAPEAFAPVGTYPTTFGGVAISRGDSYRLAAGTMGTRIVDAEDLLVSLVDEPGQIEANWQVIEGNRVTATQAEAENETSEDLSKVMPPKRWWQAWTRGLSLPAFAAAVRGTLSTGLTSSTTPMSPTSSLLVNLGRAMGLIAANTSALNGKLAKASNLSDLGSAPSARGNLGLKAYAIQDYAEALVRRVEITGADTMSLGKVVVLTSGGEYKLATPEASVYQKVGIVVSVTDVKIRVQNAGICTVFNDLSVGAAYYLKPGDPGAITADRPAAHAIHIGVAMSANELDLRPELPLPSGSVRLTSDVPGTLSGGTDSGLLSKELEGGGIYEVKVYASVVAGTDAGRVNLWLVTEGAINGFSLLARAGETESPIHWAQTDMHTAPASSETISENQDLEYCMSGVLVAGPKDIIGLRFGPMNDGRDATLKQGTILTWNRIG